MICLKFHFTYNFVIQLCFSWCSKDGSDVKSNRLVFLVERGAETLNSLEDKQYPLGECLQYRWKNMWWHMMASECKMFCGLLCLCTSRVHQQSAWREGESEHFILSHSYPPVLNRFKAASWVTRTRERKFSSFFTHYQWNKHSFQGADRL